MRRMTMMMMIIIFTIAFLKRARAGSSRVPSRPAHLMLRLVRMVPVLLGGESPRHFQLLLTIHRQSEGAVWVTLDVLFAS
eukprot:3989585-Amphidinium_carterae.1